METLKTELTKLLTNNPDLAKEYPPLETLNQNLIDFLEFTVKGSKNYVNPYVMAERLKISDTSAISLLFLIANFSIKDIFYLEYVYTCPNNHVYYLTQEELDDFYCFDCDEEYNIKELLIGGTFNLPINFRISESFFKEIQESFQSTNTTKGEPDNFTLNDIEMNLSPVARNIIKREKKHKEEILVQRLTSNEGYLRFHTR